MRILWLCLVASTLRTCRAGSLSKADGMRQEMAAFLDSTLNKRQGSSKVLLANERCNECIIDASSRKVCPGAFGGISAAQCHDLGCCFDDRVPGVPWCFSRRQINLPYVPTVKPPVSDECRGSADERIRCIGDYAGIPRGECESKECCFDDSVPGVPWCFSPKGVCDTAPAERVSCTGAYGGISAHACHELGCCFDDRVAGVPWCFPQTGATVKPPVGEECEYELTVYTSDVGYAESTGQVYVTLVGDKGTCPETLINDGKKMERNSELKFTATCPFNIGRLVSVDVRLTTTDGWHLKDMVVQDLCNDLTYRVPCDCWFDNEDPNYPSSRTLSPVLEFEYELTVYTSDVQYADSTGQVYVTLVGDKETCPETLINDGKKMERNSELKFTATCPFDIGQLLSVDIRLTTTDGWHLKKMIVHDISKDLLYTFVCECWFDNGSGAVGPSSRTLEPVTGNEYELTVYTSDVGYAESNGQVYVTLVGDVATCPETLINDGIMMQRNSELKFTATCPFDIGQLLSVDVRLTTTDGWHLKKMIVHDISKDLLYTFVCECWFDNGGDAAGPSSRTLEPVFEYELKVYTSDVGYAESSGQVYVTLIGDKAECPETLINDGRKMERNSKLKFTATCPFNIGELVRVNVRLTTTDGWHLNKMIVHDVSNDLSYTLLCDCWFDNGDPDYPSSRTLYPAYEYKLTVYTSDVQYAESSGQVYVTLVGDEATCPETLINDGQKMERNSELKFTAACSIDIGELVSVDVRLTTTDGWHMNKMIVNDKCGDLTYEVPCDCWFDNGDPGYPSSRTLTPVVTA